MNCVHSLVSPNNVIQHPLQIWDGVTTDLINSLKSSPADIETLRIYLILPLYHEFVNSKHYRTLHAPFCRAVLQLTQNPRTIILRWWCDQSKDYFERLVDIFRGVVSYIIDYQVKTTAGAKPRVEYDANLELALNTMRLLFAANHHSKKVPYDVFTIPELTENIDLRSDYVSWLMDKCVRLSPQPCEPIVGFYSRKNKKKNFRFSAHELLPLQLSVLIRCQS